MKTRITLALAICLALPWALSGCGDKSPQDADQDHQAGEHQADEHAHGDADHHADAGSGSRTPSAEDEALIKAQKVCPVSGEELGAMGGAYKIIYKGKPIFLCCKGCEADFLKDPEKYVKKLSH